MKIKVDWGKMKNGWMKGLWTISELETVLNAVMDLATALGGADNFKDKIGEITVTQKKIKEGGLYSGGWITMNEKGFSTWTVVHELAHAWDANKGWSLSKNMRDDLGAGFDNPLLHFFFPDDDEYWYDPGQGPPPCGIDRNFNEKEDFAESVTAYIYPAEAEKKANASNYPYNDPARGYNHTSFLDTPRGQNIKALMVSSP